MIEIKNPAGFRARVASIATSREPSLSRPPSIEMTDSLSAANQFDACIARQLNLCLALEALADTLPSRVDTRSAMILVDRLHPTLRRCHLLEEARVFPVLTASHCDISPILERLHTEHFEDEDHAADLREAIEEFVSRRARADAREISYMLRCLFTSLRRHLAFDRDYVLPLYRRALGL